jgi:glycosyltransferase involved in cell wall biosynthesis
LASDYLYPIGGAEIHMLDLASLLERGGHQVRLLGAEKPPGKSVLLTRIYDPRWATRLKKLVSEFKPHVIHVHNFSYVLSGSVLRMAKTAGLPVVLTVHDAHLLCPRTWLVNKEGIPCTKAMGPHCIIDGCALKPYFLYVYGKLLLHRKAVMTYVDKIIAPSRFLHRLLTEAFGEHKVINLPYFSPIKPFYPLPLPEKPRILYCGKLVPEKGVDVLIKALPAIVRAISDDVKLTVVGDGPERRRLEDLAMALGLRHFVDFVGWVPHNEVSKYYQLAWLICVPSLWQENFPLVAIESYMHGRPILGSRIGGLPELIKDGITGYLFRPGDPDDLASKAVRMLSERKLVEDMGRNMFSHLPFLDSEYFIDKLIKLYQSLFS